MRVNRELYRMGELTADQLRQIAASSNRGISDSVAAAESVGRANEAASAHARALGSEIGAWVASHQDNPGGGLRTVAVLALVGVGAWALLRRPRRGRRRA